MSLEVHLTKDLSHTLYVTELDETYHSRNGALEEALYVYIGKGLLDFINHSKTENNRSQTKEISILEIGYGTGLNTWLTAMECAKLNIKCNYTSLETVPLPLELINQLNYTDNVTELNKELFFQLHESAWNSTIEVSNNFTLQKIHTSLQNLIPKTSFDIIYFDAFAPEKQPELWTKELFQKLFDCLNTNGSIVTYSSKGEVKRIWKEIGFTVERLPGPPMKRHMLRGRKTAKSTPNQYTENTHG
ncbi:hypothetical protein AEM51_08655 [Bacteroidetes bacterium UKL13-3]|jgi:tRNA U34 5-methylaminomethyl-2-thiouridine-forming methyltransferase MnmC|nr:hypothetical protein AEM51_08655 [Bacteroidetes bacterium UKL13-3]HCP92999.1 SAM-dependent methyltransferase [Bacteroidota bacterium]